MKTNIFTTIGVSLLILIGTTVQAQETKAKNTTTTAKPAASSATKANVTTPAANATAKPANNTAAAANTSNTTAAPATAQPSNGNVNGEALAPQPTRQVQSVNTESTAKELPNSNNATPKNGKANVPAQNATTAPEAPSQKQVDAHQGHNHSGNKHAEQSHQSHSVEAPNKAKEKTNNGNAYGKNKGDLKGKDFGQDRANQAKSKQTKKKEN